MTMIAAVALVAAPMCLTSCDDDDPKPGSGPVVLTAPEFAHEAMRLLLSEDNPFGIKDITFSESGKVFITRVKKGEHLEAPGTRASETYVITGVYAVIGGVYKIDLDDEEFDMSVEGTTVTVNGESVEAQKVEPISTDDKMCRTWKIVSAKVDGIKVDLNKRKEFAETGAPQEITITKTGVVAIKFAKGTTEVTTWAMDASGKSLMLNQVLSIAVDQLMFSFTKTVTLGATVEGSAYEIYLESL